jgi:elongation factor Ts
MAISAKDVKELRDITGAGMMDCKKALTETDGDKEKAVDWLRENGLAKAAKKASRIAAEGIVKTVVSDDSKKAAIVEVNSETDFVAKNEKFQNYVESVAKQVLANDVADMDAFMASNAEDGSQTIEAELANMTATIGEKLSIRRFEKVSTDG